MCVSITDVAWLTATHISDPDLNEEDYQEADDHHSPVIDFPGLKLQPAQSSDDQTTVSFRSGKQPAHCGSQNLAYALL